VCVYTYIYKPQFCSYMIVKLGLSKYKNKDRIFQNIST